MNFLGHLEIREFPHENVEIRGNFWGPKKYSSYYPIDIKFGIQCLQLIINECTKFEVNTISGSMFFGPHKFLRISTLKMWKFTNFQMS